MSRRIVCLGALLVLGACDGTAEDDAGARPDVGVPSPGDHGYFDWLTGLPEHHHSAGLRDPTEIEANLHGRVQDPPDVEYDAAEDAARMVMRSGSGSIAQQIRVDFERVSEGSLLFYWEGRWESGFVSDGDIDGLQTNKAYQLACDCPGDDRRIEPRTRFSLADSPWVAVADTRVYHFTPSIGESQPLEPQVGAYNFRAERWTRFWAYVDFDANEYTYWIGDEETAPVVVHDRVGLDYSTGAMGSLGLNQFWFEHNSSQSRSAGSPELFIWGRNLVVLRDVADPAAIVAMAAP